MTKHQHIIEKNSRTDLCTYENNNKFRIELITYEGSNKPSRLNKQSRNIELTKDQAKYLRDQLNDFINQKG